MSGPDHEHGIPNQSRSKWNCNHSKNRERADTRGPQSMSKRLAFLYEVHALYTHIHMYMYTYTVYIYAHMHVCMYVCTYVCMYVGMYDYVCMCYACTCIRRFVAVNISMVVCRLVCM